MQLATCPHCGLRYIANAEGTCSHCGGHLPARSEEGGAAQPPGPAGQPEPGPGAVLPGEPTPSLSEAEAPPVPATIGPAASAADAPPAPTDVPPSLHPDAPRPASLDPALPVPPSLAHGAPAPGARAPEPPPSETPAPETPGGETPRAEAPPPTGAAPPAPPAAVPPQPPAGPPLGPVVADGQFRCPHCGEALYAGEQVCWNCGRRVDEAPAPAPAPMPPVSVAAAVPAAGPVAAGLQAPPPGAVGWEELARAEGRPVPSAGAMSLAYWSLGLGLASVLTCGGLSILAPVALWLGIRAHREGAGPVAVVGIVLGALGILALLGGIAWIALLIAAGSQAPSEVLLPVAGVLGAAMGGARCKP